MEKEWLAGCSSGGRALLGTGKLANMNIIFLYILSIYTTHLFSTAPLRVYEGLPVSPPFLQVGKHLPKSLLGSVHSSGFPGTQSPL